ncbi:hypothetical protein HOP50_06g46050 [Chloropicon primus]|uniref:Uncharacterized protein n=1 Tax=Chloropicon primus TaxID=1764295 RepID=A0A5B8MNH0_9CHLO|nr:hypothetical protein A3770_06p45810 [Chloropicon primus]UPR01283.1 hypothetical protein HOP50_06g46050 [Chloropicon primus]|mmetsp:Transcript_4384/g.12900  ORF Transcript_4384/g.12900 Transcript_4384/m.12900 type:complete len:133 (-) Transcript_4384:77-475(-)|eukprot:QDZ22063.1 hypothetical protein A3770_06p45810 [Chloropicon primus]
MKGVAQALVVVLIAGLASQTLAWQPGDGAKWLGQNVKGLGQLETTAGFLKGDVPAFKQGIEKQIAGQGLENYGAFLGSGGRKLLNWGQGAAALGNGLSQWGQAQAGLGFVTGNKPLFNEGVANQIKGGWLEG